VPSQVLSHGQPVSLLRESAFVMLRLRPSRHSIVRLVPHGAALGLLAAIFGLLVMGVACLGAREIDNTELIKDVAKAEQLLESRPRRTASRNSESSVWQRVATSATSGQFPRCPEHSHDTHSLPNGLRAPLLC
jgi:hypothetical protein